MTLTPQSRNQIISIIDQEEAAIAETLECEEYRDILWAVLTHQIQSLNTAIKDTDIPPSAVVVAPCNVIDLMTILRLAQVKLLSSIIEDDQPQQPKENEG